MPLVLELTHSVYTGSQSSFSSVFTLLINFSQHNPSQSANITLTPEYFAHNDEPSLVDGSLEANFAAIVRLERSVAKAYILL